MTLYKYNPSNKMFKTKSKLMPLKSGFTKMLSFTSVVVIPPGSAITENFAEVFGF